MNTEILFRFIRERHRIYERRAVGKPRPWTKDPILQSFRFTNVYRELDKVTVWIRENWRDPNATLPHLWFAMAVARLINWPDTLEELDFPVPWNASRFVKAAHARRTRGEQVFNAAYIVSTAGHRQDKVEYLAEKVLTPLWQARAKVMPRQGDTLASFAARLQEHNGFAGFMTGQVAVDTKFVMPLRAASDWWTWAVSGPGSRKGMNVVMNRPFTASWNEAEWKKSLDQLQPLVDKQAAKWGMPRISATDLQNCLCETSKIYKTLNDLGKPKSNYPGI